MKNSLKSVRIVSVRSASTNRTINNKTMGHLRKTNLIIVFFFFYFWKSQVVLAAIGLRDSFLLLFLFVFTFILFLISRKNQSQTSFLFVIFLFFWAARAFCNSQSRKILRWKSGSECIFRMQIAEQCPNLKKKLAGRFNRFIRIFRVRCFSQGFLSISRFEKQRL